MGQGIRVPVADDVFDVLEQDHRLLERLFEQYQRFNDPVLAEQICDLTTLHTTVEERLVYPLLGREVPDGSSLAKEALGEHAEVKVMIEVVRRAGYDGDGVPEVIQSMQVAIERHVEEEESELFPKMRASLEPARLDRLGEQVAALIKEQRAKLAAVPSMAKRAEQVERR